ncbi:hypothetical protein BH11BAC7_BH11BAC7_23700 [soil metagenome]
MFRTLLISSFVVFLSGNIHLSAQCVDSTQIQYGAYCDPQWIPVCGCDGITYRNDCFSRNQGLQQWSYGICEAIDFDFNPNPADPFNENVYVDVIIKTPGYMQVQLMDRFGRIFYSTSYVNPGQMTFQMGVRGFPAGLYYILIFCADGYKVRKLMIADNI